MTYDQGDVVPLGISVTDSNGALANATTVTCTIYLPDGTSTSGTVTNASTGFYNCDYTPTQVGRYTVRWVATGTNASAFQDLFIVRDFADIGIISLDDAKTYLNITDTTYDTELTRFIDVATDLCEAYVGVILGRSTFVETYDGGVDHIRLRHPQAMSITSIVEGGVTLTAGTDYYLDPTGQRVHRMGTASLFYTNTWGYFQLGRQNIVITYVAGQVNPQARDIQGVLVTLAYLWETQRGAVGVVGASGDSYTPSPTYSLPLRAQQLLANTSLPGIA